MLNAFENLYGKVINGLQVKGIARRLPELAWDTICTNCGTSGQTHTHKELQLGSAACKNAGCGKPEQRAVTSDTASVTVSYATRSARSHAERGTVAPEQPASVPIQPPPEVFRGLWSQFDTLRRR